MDHLSTCQPGISRKSFPGISNGETINMKFLNRTFQNILEVHEHMSNYSNSKKRKWQATIDDQENMEENEEDYQSDMEEDEDCDDSSAILNDSILELLNESSSIQTELVSLFLQLVDHLPQLASTPWLKALQALHVKATKYSKLVTLFDSNLND